MFSFKASDELVFGAPNPSEIRQDQQALTEETNFINFSSDNRVMNSGLTRQTQDTGRRVVHRDMERKRRLEMSNLLLTLASLLPTPTQHNKGKRGACDEMQEAANYIKSMQNKIEELRIRRDRLINLSQNKVVINSDGPCVKINVLPDGMEILVKTIYSFGLSVALDVLLAETEIDVVNCVSTPTNGRGFLHKIQIQAMDMRGLDLSVLQDKLSNAISLSVGMNN